MNHITRYAWLFSESICLMNAVNAAKNISEYIATNFQEQIIIFQFKATHDLTFKYSCYHNIPTFF